MRVVNERRWRRTKWICVLILILCMFWGVGGENELNNPIVSFALMYPTWMLVNNLTKEWRDY